MFEDIGSIGAVGNIVAAVGVAGLDKFESDLSKMANSVDGAAQFMNKSLTAASMAGAVVFASAIGAAATFESSFAGVTKTIDGISDEFGNLNDDGIALAQSFRDLAKEIPISVNELNAIAEMGGALGVPKAEIEGFTASIANLATTTDLTAEAGAESIAKFINVTQGVVPAGVGMAEQTARIGSALVDLGNKTAATESAIMAMGQRLSGAGAQAGMSQADILGLAAALSSVGIEAEMGGSAMSKMIAKMSKDVATGGGHIEDFARISKLSVGEFSDLFKKDAAGAVSLFFSKMLEMQKQGENLYPVLEQLDIKELRLSDTILRSTNAAGLFNDALVIGKKAYQDNTAMTIEAQKRYNTFESQVKLVKNQFNDTLITLGNKFLPVMKDVLKIVNENATVFAAVVGTLGTMTLAVGAAATAYKTYKTGMELAKVASAALAKANETLNLSMGPIVAVTAAVAAMVVAYNAIRASVEGTSKKIIEGIGATSDDIAKVSQMGQTIMALKDSQGLTTEETMRLADATAGFEGKLKSVGLSVNDFGGDIQALTNAYKELREQELLKQREALDALAKDYNTTDGIIDFFADSIAGVTGKAKENVKQIEAINTELNELQGPLSTATTGTSSLATATDKSSTAAGAAKDVWALLDEANIKTTKSIQDQIDKFEALLPQVQGDKVATAELQKKIDDLKDSLDPANEELKKQKSSQELLKEAGIETTAAIQDQIKKLEALLPAVQGDEKALGMLNKAIQDQKDKLVPVNEEARKKKELDEALAKAGIETTDSINKQIQGYKDLLPKVEGDAYATEQLKEKIKDLEDQTKKQTNAQKLQTEAFAMAGNAVGELISKVGGGAPVFQEFGSAIASIATGAFNPISTGIAIVGSLVSTIIGGTGKVQLTIEQVYKILGPLGKEVENLHNEFERLGDAFQSDLMADLDATIADLSTKMAEVKKKLDLGKPNVQGWDQLKGYYDQLSAALDKTMKQQAEFLQAFSFDDSYNMVAEGMQVLSSRAVEMGEKFGNIKWPGLEKLLDESIVKGQEMLATLDPESNAYKELGQQVLFAQASLDVLKGVYPDMNAWIAQNGGLVDASNEVWADYIEIADRATESTEMFSTAYSAMLDQMTGQTDSFKSASMSIERMIEQIQYYALDLSQTEIDENIIGSLVEMYNYIGTLNPGSEASKDAQKTFDDLLQKFYQLGFTWEDVVAKVGAPIMAEIKPVVAAPVVTQETIEAAKGVGGNIQNAIADEVKPIEIVQPMVDGGAIEKAVEEMPPIVVPIYGEVPPGNTYWEGIFADFQEEYKEKSGAVVGQLDAQWALLGALRDGEQSKIAKIDAEYTALIEDKTKESIEAEKNLKGLYEKRAETFKAFKTEAVRLKETSRDVVDALVAFDTSREQQGIRDLEQAITDLTGKTRSFALDWDSMVSKIVGGTRSEFQEAMDNISGAQGALEKAIYFGQNISGSDFSKQMNSMIYSVREFILTLDPDSKAFQDATTAMDELMGKFQDAGGQLDPAAATKAAKDWAMGIANELNAQANQVEKQGVENIIKVDADISEAKKKVMEADLALDALKDKWQEERIGVELDIEKAQATITTLYDELRDLYAEWNEKQITLWVASEGTVGVKPPEYRVGGYVPKTTLAVLHGNEFVLNQGAVGAIGRDNLEKLNAGVDPNVFSAIQASKAIEKASAGDDSRGEGHTVIVHEAMPGTWVEVIDKKIHPRVIKRDQKNRVGANPYAERS